MQKSKSKLFDFLYQLVAIILALLLTFLVLFLAEGQPIQAFKSIIVGSVGSINSFSNVLVAWVPLLIATAAVLVTFAAGLWNLGIEGQITMGAIFSTWLLRILQDSSLPPFLIIFFGILAGALGGAFWAAFLGLLKTYGGINEIFAGLGLNFVATSLNVYLIFGPWKRSGIATMSGTELFHESLWFPTIGNLRLSWWSLGIGIFAIVFAFFILHGTQFGLQFKAIGKNRQAAKLLGVSTNQQMMLAFILCGILGGLAGAIQIFAVYHRLIPSISSGYGYLGLLIGMLINSRTLLAIPVSLFFASLNIGSIRLPIMLQLDSTLSGVIQGFLVLLFLMMSGVRQSMKQSRRVHGGDNG